MGPQNVEETKMQPNLQLYHIEYATKVMIKKSRTWILLAARPTILNNESGEQPLLMLLVRWLIYRLEINLCFDKFDFSLCLRRIASSYSDDNIFCGQDRKRCGISDPNPISALSVGLVHWSCWWMNALIGYLTFYECHVSALLDMTIRFCVQGWTRFWSLWSSFQVNLLMK
jgi:hypothetical protein